MLMLAIEAVGTKSLDYLRYIFVLVYIRERCPVPTEVYHFLEHVVW